MKLNDCARLLCEHDRFLLLTHRHPDGDTMGSAAALCAALRRKGKTAYLSLTGRRRESCWTIQGLFLRRQTMRRTISWL